jgi:hypothetical protein
MTDFYKPLDGKKQLQEMLSKTMTTEENRREFEEWAESDNYSKSRKADGNYEFISSYIAWKIWKAARERQWLPIETAPKDGTEILTWDGKDYKFCQWLDVSEIWDDKRKMGWSSGYDYEYMSHYMENPTHWMHLPNNPPTSEKPSPAGLNDLDQLRQSTSEKI